MCAARAAAGLRGRLRGVSGASAPHGPFACAARWTAGTLSVGRMAGTGDRSSGQAATGGPCRWGDATIGAWDGAVDGTSARWRHDPDRLHRTAQRHVSGTAGDIGAADAVGWANRAATGTGNVAGGSGLQLLHPAWQSGTRADPGDGGGDQRSLLGRGRTVALPCPSPTVATAGTSWETRTATERVATPRGAVGDMTTVLHTPTAISLAVGRRNSMRETVHVRPTALRHSADWIRFHRAPRSFDLAQNERGGNEQG